MVGRTLSPIDRLSRQAAAASVESLDVRLAAPSRDAEVVRLVATLNGLLQRLSDAAESRGRFYAAASHELRNPLQALLGHVEVTLDKERDREGATGAPWRRCGSRRSASRRWRATCCC